jgi:hypothetical protein
VLAGLLGPGGPLAGRTRVYLVDKHYFVASKIIDLLLEEEAHARGINLYENDLARRVAWTLFTDGPRALGGEGFDRVIAAMVGFASSRNRDGSVVSVDALFEELRLALGRAHRKSVSQILAALLKTRRHAEDYLSTLEQRSGFVPAMEPLIAALPLIANLWSEEIGALSMLTDEHKVLTDERLDITAKMAALDVRSPDPAWARVGVLRSGRSARRSVECRGTTLPSSSPTSWQAQAGKLPAATLESPRPPGSTCTRSSSR